MEFVNREVVARSVSSIQPEFLIALLLFIVWIGSGFSNVSTFILCLILLSISQYVSKSNLILKGKDRKSRYIPYIVTSVSYALCTIVLLFLEPHSVYFQISASLTACAISLAISNLFIKVSVHCGGISAFSAICSYLFYPVGVISVTLVPLIVWSRLYLGKHTKREACIGVILGVLSSGLSMVVL